jgi:hypothetical protein
LGGSAYVNEFIGSAFLINPKSQFTPEIDAPVETKEQLERQGIADKILSKV